MKTTLSVSVITIAMFFGQASDADLDLQPSINGTVSGSGVYVSDGSDALAQDPCLNSDVFYGDKVANKLLNPSGFGVF